MVFDVCTEYFRSLQSFGHEQSALLDAEMIAVDVQASKSARLMHRCLLTFVVDNALQSLMVTMFIGRCQVLAKDIKGGIVKAFTATANHPCTFPFVEKWQTLAHLEKLVHSTVESAQVLCVNLRKIHERGFFFKFALSLKLEKLSRSLLRLYHDRDE